MTESDHTTPRNHSRAIWTAVILGAVALVIYLIFIASGVLAGS